MGKTKELGKKHKSNKVSEESEQKKIKQGIHKAFQARLSSPGQGGALLVAEPNNSNGTQKKNVRKSKNTKTAVIHNAESDDSSSDSMSENRKRNKSRKANYSKKKKSSKSASSGNKKQTEVDAAVSKHMRIAHGITGPSTTMKDNSMINFNLMARNRVSQKVGLINTGKKGAPASKGFVVPEHISRQVDAGVKKLVQEAGANIQSTTTDLDIAETMVLSKCRSAGSDRITPTSATFKAVPSSSGSVESMKNDTPPCAINHDTFPQVLPVKQTVLQLLSSLKSKQYYPGRNYLRETQEKLLKCLKPNTPLSSTPSSTPGFHITKSGSIKRSLIELFDNQPLEQTMERIEYSSHTRPSEQAMDRIGFSSHQRPTSVNSCNSDQHLNHPTSRNDYDNIMTKHTRCDSVLNSLSHFREKCNQERQGERSRHILEEIRSFIDRGKLVASLNENDGKRNKHETHEAINLPTNNRNNIGGRGNRNNIGDCSNRNNIMDDRGSRNYMGDHGDHRKVRNCEGKPTLDLFHTDYHGEDSRPVSKDRFKPQIDLTLCDTKSYADDFFLPSNTSTTEERNSPILMWVNSVSQDEDMCGTNAQDLLQANEVKKTAASRFEPMDIEERHSDAVNLLQRNDKVMEMSADKPVSIIQPGSYDRNMDDVGRHSRSHSQHSYSSQESSHQSTIQQPARRSANYMPGFHDRYYLDHMATGDLAWDHKTNKQKVEAMDILDYIDQQVYTGSQVDGLGDRIGEVREYPEWSDDHQPVHVLPRPPSSPGGPKFYPMKMY